MRRQNRIRILSIAVFLTLAITINAPAEPTITQTFTLQPGWNAIFLEVQPEPRTPPKVFQGVPVESVWTWHERNSPVQFIQDPAEGLWGKPGWSVYYKTSQEAFLTNLFAIQANRAYLVKLGGSQPVTWSVTGRPAVPRISWTPDSFNLAGFAVDPASPPSFQNFFAPSTAHAGQAVYRLNSNGEWAQVANPGSERMRRGEAYWIFCRGGSEYTGPLRVNPERLNGLAYGDSVDEQTLRIRNLATAGRTVTVRAVATGASPLAFRSFDSATLNQWLPLPAQLAATTGSDLNLRLAVKRASFTATDFETVIEVTDGAGSLVRVPLVASAPHHNSLWIGTVAVNRVGEVNRDPAIPTPTGSEFQFRLMLHVDASRQARLLKEVIQLWEDGTTVPAANTPGYEMMDRPGRYVLVTRDELISQFSGSMLRDGEPVGRRISTAAFDFAGDSLPMTGSFGAGNTLSGIITLPADFPTNPYRHRYHPDHETGFDITRSIELEFTTNDPDGLNPPGWGYSVFGGVYRETVSGLHKKNISVQGTFRISLASTLDTLNPEPRN